MGNGLCCSKVRKIGFDELLEEINDRMVLVNHRKMIDREDLYRILERAKNCQLELSNERELQR